MNYRLLALDLDGTLLNSRKEITQATKDAIARIKQNGVKVVLSTGRIVGEAVEFAREIDSDDFMVTAGGAAISSVRRERNLFEWDMPAEIGARVVEQTHPHDDLCRGQGIYQPVFRPRFCCELSRGGLSRQ